MRDDRGQLLDRAAALRDAFDHAFAEPLAPDPPALTDLLAIRIGTEAYALRLSEIGGLFTDRRITPVASRVPALLGIAGFRGAIVPVYDLHILLGHHAVEAARWLAMAADASVAFAFAAQEGQMRCGPDAIIPYQPDNGQPGNGQSDAGPSRRHVREFVRSGDTVRPIIDLFTVVDAIRRQLSANPNTTNPNTGER